MSTISPRITTTGRTKLETVIPLDTPYLVFMDPSNICNAKCQWCPTGSGTAYQYRSKSIMPFELAKVIIDDLASMPSPIKTLRLYKDGEPLLNPEFGKIALYARSTGRFGSIDTTTNGLLFSNCNILEMLVGSELDKIFISVPCNYSKEYVYNIEWLYRMLKENAVRTKIHVKIIQTKSLPVDHSVFYKDFRDITDSMYVEHLSPCWPNFKVDGVEDVGIYGGKVEEVLVCPYIMYSIAINSDGSISACFLCWKGNMIAGQYPDDTVSKVWGWRNMNALRRMMLRGERKSHPFCGNCGQLAYGAPDNIDQYREELLGRIK